jgi:tetratricopeptide (TPR) repeat protein
MTRNTASTSRHAADDPESAGSRPAVEDAARLAEQAEEILGDYLEPGKWPTARVAGRFLADGDLERVLGFYMQAMDGDPLEPAYPWNLASALDRLRLPDLAVLFIRRAIRVARETGDREWAGADAHLALADIAIRAGDVRQAELAIEQALQIDSSVDAERYIRSARRARRESRNPGRVEFGRDDPRSGLPTHILDELAIIERDETGRQ